jgi:hypothetical protein
VEKCKDCVGANKDMVMIGDRRFAFFFVPSPGVPLSMPASQVHFRLRFRPKQLAGARRLMVASSIGLILFCAAINLPIQRQNPGRRKLRRVHEQLPAPAPSHPPNAPPADTTQLSSRTARQEGAKRNPPPPPPPILPPSPLSSATPWAAAAGHPSTPTSSA